MEKFSTLKIITSEKIKQRPIKSVFINPEISFLSGPKKTTKKD